MDINVYKNDLYLLIGHGLSIYDTDKEFCFIFKSEERSVTVTAKRTQQQQQEYTDLQKGVQTLQKQLKKIRRSSSKPVVRSIISL